MLPATPAIGYDPEATAVVGSAASTRFAAPGAPAPAIVNGTRIVVVPPAAIVEKLSAKACPPPEPAETTVAVAPDDATPEIVIGPPAYVAFDGNAASKCSPSIGCWLNTGADVTVSR